MHSIFTNTNPEDIKNVIYVSVILLWFWVIFSHTEKLEKILLWNFTKIIFSIIFILFFTKFDFIEISKEVMYLIWWLFAFWYWYKKYERDKELKLIEEYTKEYDSIRENFVNENKNEFNSNKLVNFWNKEFYIASKWYVDKNLWDEWSCWIGNDLYKIILMEGVLCGQKNKESSKPIKWKELLDTMVKESLFIKWLRENYKWYKKKNDTVRINKYTFPEFLVNLLKNKIENEGGDKIGIFKAHIREIENIINQPNLWNLIK